MSLFHDDANSEFPVQQYDGHLAWRRSPDHSRFHVFDRATSGSRPRDVLMSDRGVRPVRGANHCLIAVRSSCRRDVPHNRCPSHQSGPVSGSEPGLLRAGPFRTGNGRRFRQVVRANTADRRKRTARFLCRRVLMALRRSTTCQSPSASWPLSAGKAHCRVEVDSGRRQSLPRGGRQRVEPRYVDIKPQSRRIWQVDESIFDIERPE